MKTKVIILVVMLGVFFLSSLQADECMEGDCEDGFGCTRDVCYHRNTTQAFCGHLEIRQCSESRSDGCCPGECNAIKYIDCDPDCGNDICEDFYDKETYNTCHQDCPRPEDDD